MDLLLSYVKIESAEINVNIDANRSGLNATTNAESEAPRQVTGISRIISLPTFKQSDEVAKLSQRGVFVAHYDIDAVFAGATLKQSDIMATIAASNQAQRSNLINTSPLVLTMEVQGCAFGGGKMVLCAQPVVVSTGTIDPPFGSITNRRYEMMGIHNVDNLPHVYIDPSTTATYELELPLLSPQMRLHQTGVGDSGPYWVIRFFHMMPPVTGTASAFDAHATLFARWKERAQFGAIVPLSAEELRPQGTISGIVEKAGSVAEFVGSVFPPLLPFTTPLAAISGPFAAILRVFGFSKPTRDDASRSVINSYNETHSHCDGISDAHNLGFHTHPNVAIDDGYAGGKHEDMLFSNICLKRGFVDSFTISQASASGTSVYTCNVFPTMRWWYSATARGRAPLGYAALAFENWKGSLHYRFHFIGSVFHRATVVIAYFPYISVAPTMQQAIFSAYHKKIALSGNVEVDFEVPWTSTSLWKQVIQPANGTAPNLMANTLGHIGRIYVYVMNPVETNGSTDGYPVLVSISSPDMQFARPTTKAIALSNGAQTVPLSSESLRSAEFQNATSISFGENYPSVKEVCSIMAPVEGTNLSSSFTTDDAIQFSSRADLFPRTFIGNRNSFAHYFSGMFSGYRGSIKVSLLMSVNGVTAAANGNPMSTTCLVQANYFPGMSLPQLTGNVGAFNPSAFFGAYLVTKASAMDNNAITPSVDFNMPHMYPEAYQIVAPELEAKYKYTARWRVPLGISAGSAYVVQPLIGVGDDFTFGMFLGTPVEVDL